MGTKAASLALRPHHSETPLALVHELLLAYRRHGVCPLAALARADISPQLLAQPQAKVTLRQVEVLTRATMRELDDEGLGLYSRRVPRGSFEMLLRASMASPDLGAALRHWCHFRRLLVPDLDLALTVHGTQVRLDVHERAPLGEVRHFALLSVLRQVHGVASWLADTGLPLAEVWLPGAPPAHPRMYAVMFPGPVQFDAPQAGLCFDAKYLALPVRRDEPSLKTVLQHTSRLALRSHWRERPLAPQVCSFLARRVGQPVTAAEVARAVNLSIRSLHRKLAAEGTRLQALKDTARRAHALELLARHGVPTKRIAARLGFGNEKSFSRAFERWTGRTPAAWRDEEP